MHLWPALLTYIASKDFWTTVLPSWLAAFGTVGAVIVALYQSQKGSREAIKTQQYQVTPIVVPEIVYPVFGDPFPDSNRITRFDVTVVNFGTGPALNLKVEIRDYGSVFGTSMVYRPDSQRSALTQRPNVHLSPGEHVILVAECSIEAPASFRARAVYDSVFRKRFSSPWFTFEVPVKAVRDPITIEFESI